MDMVERVEQFIQEQRLFQTGQTVVVGVSGGPDSLCLLDLLHRLTPAWKLTLQVAHLNHGLRAEATAEAEKVRAEAEKRELPCHTAEVDTRARAAAGRLSIEEAARELRYAFLAQVARATGATALAVAHTADDQAETVLMHFLRGAGLSGLKGMRAKSRVPPSASAFAPVEPQGQAEVHGASLQTRRPEPGTSDLTLIRPLLGTTRAEVEAYCTEHELQPVHDATNLDPQYFRNRLRHVLLPELEKYNPNLRAGLCRSAAVLTGEYEWLRAQVNALWQRAARLTPGQVAFDRPLWQALTVPEQRALLREAVARLQRSPRDIDFAPIEAAVQFSRRAGAGRSCDVLGGLRLFVSYTRLTLSTADMGGPAAENTPRLDADSQLAPGWQFCVTPLSRGQWPPPRQVIGAGWEVGIDAACVTHPLRVRARRPGDCFQPLGLGGHRQKISDYMVNAKLEAPLRDRWPLVVSGDDIVWLAGLRLDERFKVTDATETILQLEFVKQGA